MSGSVRRLRVKARRLLQLYSLWHETQREDVRRQCEGLLGEILRIEPGFNLRGEFKKAF